MGWMQTFADEYAIYGYPVLFIGVLLENAAIPVPGETAVLLAGFMASPAGGGRFELGWVIFLTAVAAILGDNLGFWLGQRWARPRLEKGGRFLFLTPATLRMTEGYFQRYGLWTVFFARFIAGLRVVGALAAGTAGMHWGRFCIANAAGAIAWALTASLLGYFFGGSLELLHKWLGRGGLLLGGMVLLVVGMPYLGRHLRKLSPALLGGPFRPFLLQGGLLAGLQVLLIVLLEMLSRSHHVTYLDQIVKDWLAAHGGPGLRYFANIGSVSGILPVTVVVTACVVWVLRRQGRPWQEMAPAIWALVASEALGLLVVAMLRHGHVEPMAAVSWPFGYAGLIPIRATAVLGMAAYLLAQPKQLADRIGIGVVVVLILWAAFSVVGTERQLVTEALLEVAAGVLVLLAGVWWLQGFGGGVVAMSETKPNSSPVV